MPGGYKKVNRRRVHGGDVYSSWSRSVYLPESNTDIQPNNNCLIYGFVIVILSCNVGINDSISNSSLSDTISLISPSSNCAPLQDTHGGRGQ